MAEEGRTYRRVEERHFRDSEGRAFTMMTDLDTGEVKFLGRWNFIAKMSDGQGNLYEQDNPQAFPIEVEGEGKSVERQIRAFEAFDRAKEAHLAALNASIPKIHVAGKG
jgi:hypothetical protein